MRKGFLLGALAVALAGALFGFASPGEEPSRDFTTGTPDIRSISALAFGPEGVLFIGDGKGGAVFALALDDKTKYDGDAELAVQNIEAKIAAFVGTTADEILIHDMAANPVSQNVYLAVSRGRGKWSAEWVLPNDFADASLLVKVDRAGGLNEVSLKNVSFAKASLKNPVAPGKKHRWKEGVELRADTITDMSYSRGTLYVAGLSNEEFSSTLWRIPYPFADGMSATTLEIFHGAHGEYETHAPIRTFVPYALGGKEHILAAYLCTPLVTFPLDDLKDGRHVKGRTVGEFGSGNYPLDMVVYEKKGVEKLLIANSNLPFLIVDPRDIEAYEGSITAPTETYVAGVRYEPRSGTGIQQLDVLNRTHLVSLRRLANGKLDLNSTPIERF